MIFHKYYLKFYPSFDGMKTVKMTNASQAKILDIGTVFFLRQWEEN